MWRWDEIQKWPCELFDRWGYQWKRFALNADVRIEVAVTASIGYGASIGNEASSPQIVSKSVLSTVVRVKLSVRWASGR